MIYPNKFVHIYNEHRIFPYKIHVPKNFLIGLSLKVFGFLKEPSANREGRFSAVFLQRNSNAVFLPHAVDKKLHRIAGMQAFHHFLIVIRIFDFP